jgi:hypothetical protein
MLTDCVWKVRVQAGLFVWTDLVKAGSMKEARDRAMEVYDRWKNMDDQRIASINGVRIKNHRYKILHVKRDKQNLSETQLTLGEMRV